MAAATPTPAPSLTRSIPIAKITWPTSKKDERTFDQEFALKLADSIATDGLIHAITVMEDPAKPGHFIGVLGRHRCYGCEKGLKWKEIPAIVLGAKTDDDVKSLTIAENLWRNPLDKHQRSKAIAEWHRIYEARTAPIRAEKAAKKQAAKSQKGAKSADAADPAGDSPAGETPPVQVGPGEAVSDDSAPVDTQGEAESAAAAKPDATGGFAAEVSAATGMSKTAVKRSLKIGKAFSDDQIRTLDENGVSQDAAETMARLSQAQRDDAMSLIASGMDPIEAIGEATKQDVIKTAGNRTLDARRGSAADREAAKQDAKKAKAENQVGDDDWIAQECGDRMAVLPETTRPVYRQHALLYRHTRDLRRAFANKVAPIMDQARKGGVKFGMAGIINRMLGMEHPKAWLMCGDCDGNGTRKDGKGCPKCNALGFLVGFVGKKGS